MPAITADQSRQVKVCTVFSACGPGEQWVEHGSQETWVPLPLKTNHLTSLSVRFLTYKMGLTPLCSFPLTCIV